MLQLAVENGNYVNGFKVISGKNSGRIYDGKAGVSKEVYALRTKEEIQKMLDVFNKHIEEADSPSHYRVACRNKLLFQVGINIGIRVSDLIKLKWNFFFDEDGTFKNHYKFQPKKTRKTGKFVTLKFNDTVKKVVTDYYNENKDDPFVFRPNEDNYVFKSNKGMNKPITENGVWRMMDKAAGEAGIKLNVGSHTLRKTFGYWVWHNAEDKNRALVLLQKIFNHSCTQVTMNYIGIMQDDLDEMYDSLDIGMEL